MRKELYKMKKFFVIILSVISCCLLLTACSINEFDNSLDFISDNLHCVVSLPQGYDIVYVNDEFDNAPMLNKDLQNAKTVNGKQKNDEFRYYNILKNEPFKIITPISIIQNKNESGQTLVYWKLNNTLYKDGDNYYSETVFFCSENTEITPVYYEFRAVGMLLYEVDENDMPTVQDNDVFDENGTIKEQEGLYYLYGVYDFEPYQELWRTNLTINKYEINQTSQQIAENYNKRFYTINIEINKGNLFNKGKIIVEKLYKIDGHGYMTYGALNVIQGDDTRKAIYTLPVGDHEIRYTFT